MGRMVGVWSFHTILKKALAGVAVAVAVVVVGT